MKPLDESVSLKNVKPGEIYKFQDRDDYYYLAVLHEDCGCDFIRMASLGGVAAFTLGTPETDKEWFEKNMKLAFKHPRDLYGLKVEKEKDV